MSRDEALSELQKPTYDPDLQEQDKVYVAKKLGFSDAEFEDLLSLPNRDHLEFGNDLGDLARLRRVMGWIRPVTNTAKRLGWRLDI